MNTSRITPRQVAFEVASVEDSVETARVFVAGRDKAVDCHTVIANRPVRIRLQMLSQGESFANYKLQYEARYCDGGDIIGQTDQKAVGSRVTRPIEVSEDGQVLTAPIYFHMLYSQTQKKPIMVQFYLEENGQAVSDWVLTPPFKVVSKPPMSVRGAAPAKRRKCNEGDSYEGANEEDEGATDTSADKYSHILAELKQIKSMMTAVKPDPEVSNEGSSRPLKRKLEEAPESNIAKRISSLSQENISHMLRELASSYPEAFSTMMALGTVMQMRSSSTLDNFTTYESSDNFEMKF